MGKLKYMKANLRRVIYGLETEIAFAIDTPPESRLQSLAHLQTAAVSVKKIGSLLCKSSWWRGTELQTDGHSPVWDLSGQRKSHTVGTRQGVGTKSQIQEWHGLGNMWGAERCRKDQLREPAVDHAKKFAPLSALPCNLWLYVDPASLARYPLC